MKRLTALFSALLALVLSMSATGTASAATVERSAGVSSYDQISGATEGDKATKTATDRAILELLLAGTGPIAAAKPELVEYLGFDPARPKTDPRALKMVITKYLAFEKNFGSLVREPLDSGDPLRVERALLDLTDSFQRFMAQSPDIQQKGVATPTAKKGCGKTVCVAVLVLAVANAGVYANVGLATFAVATLAVTWFYLMGEEGSATQLEQDHFVALMADAV